MRTADAEPTMLGAVARPFKRAGWAKVPEAPEGQLWLDAPRRRGRHGRTPARLMVDYSRAQLAFLAFDETGQLARRFQFSPVDAATYEAVAAFVQAQAAQAGAGLE
jgi:hypothetical protein